MAYRGNFVKSNAVDTAGHPARLNWGTGVDPGHAVPTWGKDLGFPALKNPPLAEVPTYIEDAYDPELAESPYFMAQDREPRGHAGTGAPPRTSHRYDEIESDTARHQENYGADLKGSMPMVMRSVTQTFDTPREQSLPPSQSNGGTGVSGQAMRALRGDNALAINNPGNPEVNGSGNYIRQGYEISRITDRRMPNRTLRHTRRPLHLNLASIAHETTTPQGDNYSPYSSPFTSVARVTSGIARPMQRREPRPWDESATTDGTEDSYTSDTDQYNSWGL
jgi:hypothetical protein